MESIGTSNRRVPAIEVKYLAVDQRFQGRGIGKFVVEGIIGEIYSISQRFACRYIFLRSVPEALEFYRKRFFVDMEQTNSEKLRLMMFLVPDPFEVNDEV